MSDEGRLIAGRYRLIERIGRGGMGTVWRAEDEVLGREIALKRLHAQQHLSEDELATVYERTRREARSAARITHPNVVVVHDVLDDEGLPCIVMEYVHGTTLGALLKGGGALPPGEAARVGLGMVAALRAAHAAGVLHRDVKPGNVLLGGNGRVVLTDFGIAMATGTSTLTKTGEIIGSIDYIAPERMKGHKPGPTADLWALGATLFQSVEGRPPFRRATAMETAYAIAVDPLAPMKQAGPLEPLIEMLLAKDPDERPSAEETERALRVVASEAPGATTGVTVGATTGGATGVAWASAVPSRATATVAATGPTTSAGATLADSGSRVGSVPPAPTGGSGRDSGDGTGRPGRKRRPLIWSAAAADARRGGRGGRALRDDVRQRWPRRQRGEGFRDGDLAHRVRAAPRPRRVPSGQGEGTGSHLPRPGRLEARRQGEHRTGHLHRPVGPGRAHHRNREPRGREPRVALHDHRGEHQAQLPDVPETAHAAHHLPGTARGGVGVHLPGPGPCLPCHRLRLRRGGRHGVRHLPLGAPEAQWDTHRPVFDTVKSGFRVG
ncbi:serine/threonine-protein kinase [Streptomyces sp. GLT-R25]